MPLRLNLYHEVHKAKALKRRDPLKISIYALAAIAICCAAWYIILLLRLHVVNSELAARDKEFHQIEPAAKVAKKKEEELLAQVKASDQLVKRMENRFYWAPIFSELMQVVPREVQITRMTGDLTGEGLRRCSISIDGLAAGTDPRRVAEELRTALAERFAANFKNVTSTFKALEDGAESVTVDGRQLATATFGINVQLFSGVEPPPAAPARGKKR